MKGNNFDESEILVYDIDIGNVYILHHIHKKKIT